MRYRERVGRELAAEVDRLRSEFRQGRRRDLARKAAERLLREPPELAEPAEEAGGPPRVGRGVRHRTLGWEGRLESVDGDRALVHVGGKKVRCRLDELAGIETPAGAGAAKTGERAAGHERGGEEVAAELLLLGLRVEEGLEALDDYLDRALRSGRSAVRVVHGHGTGRLREAVRAHLRSHPAVETQRPGAANEGGDGATVVTLRE